MELAAIGPAAKNVAPFATAAMPGAIAPFERVILAEVFAQADVKPAVRRERNAADAVVRVGAGGRQFQHRRARFAHAVAIPVAQNQNAVAMGQVELSVG